MKNIYFGFLVIGIIVANCVFAEAQPGRGANNVTIKDSKGKKRDVKLYQGSYALIISESVYTAGWDNLPGASGDAEAVKAALERQEFTVKHIANPDKREMTAAIQQFIEDYGYSFENRLIIYFAGHGHTDILADGRSVGYIVPSDAPLPSADKIGFERKAIDLGTMESYAEQIRAKHAMFIFDSCFSGKMLTSRSEIAVPPYISEELTKPVRQFITAGAANQAVPDESIFRRMFVRGLDGEADVDQDGYILGSELAQFLKREVTKYSKRAQTPQYGKILNLDLNQGDFVFIVPDKSKVESAKNCTGESTPLKIISKPQANYTDFARQAQEQGIVELEVTFLASGQIGSVGIVKRLEKGLTEQAISAARQIRFVPATECGTPKTVKKVVRYNFSIY